MFISCFFLLYEMFDHVSYMLIYYSLIASLVNLYELVDDFPTYIKRTSNKMCWLMAYCTQIHIIHERIH